MMNTLSRLSIALCAVVATSTPTASVAENGDAATGRFSLTIYSSADPATFDPQQLRMLRGSEREPVPGFGVVREIRRVPLLLGPNLLKFTDVAAGIDPTTVSFKSLTSPQTTVLEQNFEYDVMSAEKLLEKYLGRSIIINRKQPLAEGERVPRPETIEARLLSFNDTELVLQTNNKQLPVQIVPRNSDITEMKLFDLSTGLITRPTLVWKIQADRAGDHDVLVSYQTENITWRADYGVIVSTDDKAGDLSAWVTVVNESGASYPDAKLKLVAGDVQRLRPPAMPRGRGGGGGLFGGGGGDTGFKERSFFEYHLYTLGRPTTLANRSTKQIELFAPRANLPLEKILVYRGFGETEDFPTTPWMDEGLPEGGGNTKVDVFLKFRNSEKNGLGIPLPAGRVRVYKRDDADADDPAGMLEFIGEDQIGHTPREEDVLVRMGTAFDVVAERNATSFTVDHERRTITEAFAIKLRNRKKEPVTVLVREKLYRWINWEITVSSSQYEKRDARTIQFPVEIAPDQEKTVTYTVKYTW